MDILRKALTVRKVEESGQVHAVIATMNIIDKDGDVTFPGFFGKQEVVIVPTHDWGSVPIGKGIVTEDANEAHASIQLNLNVEEGRKWFEALKFDMANGTPKQEWSYGFRIHKGASTFGQFNGQDVRQLKPLADGSPGCIIHEVSPVLVGAGEGTRTLAVKGTEDSRKRFCDEAGTVLDAVEGFVERAVSLAELRAKDGRALSVENVERLKALVESLAKAVQAVMDLTVDVNAEALNEAARLEAWRFNNNGGAKR